METTNQGMNVQTAGTTPSTTTGAGSEDYLGVIALTGAGLLAATGLVLRRRHTTGS